MNIVIFTSNALRHKYVANTLASHANTLVVSECKKSDAPPNSPTLTPMEQNFADRYAAEHALFAGNDVVNAPTLPLEYKEVNLPYVFDAVKAFKPDMGFVFGSSIIREPLLSLIPAGRFVNMHLGLSPYYRGSGTNFWPFINEELEYIGATLLHIDAGIDTGDIVAHVRPRIEHGDTVHTVGCKTIQAGSEALVACLKTIKAGQDLQRVPQWHVEHSKYYKTSDFNEQVLNDYLTKIRTGLVERHLQKTPAHLRLVTLTQS